MKQVRILQVSALLLMAMSLSSCVEVTRTLAFDGKKVVETRNLKGFEEIEISGSPTVYYTQADTFSVRVEGKADAVERIITEVEYGTLRIRNRSKVGPVNVVITTGSQPVVHVTSPDLVGIHLKGSGDFISEHRIDTDVINVDLRGSGDIDIDELLCDRCRVELVGSGDIDIKRLEAQATTAELVGSGDIDIRQHKVDTTSLLLKGSGDINVDFVDGCNSANCELYGSGDIDLKGSLRHLSSQKRGSGDIDIDKLYVGK